MKKTIRSSLILSVLLFTLTGCNVDFSDIGSKLIPSWPNFVAQIAALVVLIIIGIVVGYKPLKKMLKKRSDYVENHIQEAENKNAEASKNIAQANEYVLESKKNATDIIEKAEKDAKAIHDQMIEKTEQEISQMKKLAAQDIERSKQEAIDEIHNEIVSVALAASGEILKREVNEQDNTRIVNDFIKEIK